MLRRPIFLTEGVGTCVFVFTDYSLYADFYACCFLLKEFAGREFNSMELKDTVKKASEGTSEKALGNVSKPAAGRLRFVDIAKGISIICIILGHLGIHNITRVVFTFHVPIFFLIALLKRSSFTIAEMIAATMRFISVCSMLRRNVHLCPVCPSVFLQ